MDNNLFRWLILGAVLMAVLNKDKFLPRGIRNNNPGNIKESPTDKTQWVGERATDDDKIFEEFTSPIYGIRALTKIIKNYNQLYGLDTINKIISRYAPGSENDTKRYIEFVTNYTKIPGYKTLNFNNNSNDLYLLIKGIIRFENGINPYSETTIKKGIALS